MIVPMRKAFAACRRQDRDRMLRRLRGLGLVHLVAADGGKGTARTKDEETRALGRLDAALQILEGVEPTLPSPAPLDDLPAPVEVVAEVLEIRRRQEEGRLRMDALHRELDRLPVWAGVRLEDLYDLLEAGVDLEVLSVPRRALPLLRARVAHVLGPLPRQRLLVATVGLDASSLTPRVSLVPPPARSHASIVAEAAEVEAGLAADRERLAELAARVADLEREGTRLRRERRWREAARSGLAHEHLFAVQGWLPAEEAPSLAEELPADDLDVALQVREPDPDDAPPTLVRYPRWARPIDRLFRVLSMVPGYDELDVSTAFMVALPVFAGMIIGDAGYGLFFLLAALLGRLFPDRAPGRLLDPDLRVIVGLFGAAALAWGAATGVWFGVTPGDLAGHGPALAGLGAALDRLQVVRGSEDDVRRRLMEICFLLGTAHLLVAHGRRFLALSPAPSAWAEAGWCVVLVSTLGFIWILFFGAPVAGLAALVGAGLTAGLGLVVLFSRPDRPFPARLGLGLAGSLLPLLGAFGDTLSYIRLMAVGLASYYLGSTFNTLGAAVATRGTWLAGGTVLVAGHLLNLGLILIAIFAHGVRLNVLEFSSHAGIHWTGHPYRPFADEPMEEST